MIVFLILACHTPIFVLKHVKGKFADNTKFLFTKFHIISKNAVERGGIMNKEKMLFRTCFGIVSVIRINQMDRP